MTPSEITSQNGDSRLLNIDFQLYICNACGLIYDEAKGDPDSGLAAGTRFADIPEDWACPLCGVTKADFSPYTPPAPDAMRQQMASVGEHLASRGPAGVVIVGAGKAGWQMAESLRALDASVPITLVSACEGHVYDKPLLSVAMARGIGPDQLVKETGTDAARRLRVRLVTDAHAVRICPDTQTLRTPRGNFRFDELVLAHGAQAALPPALPASATWRVNHLGAYQKLRAALGDSPQQVVIVGAGLVGCELANDLALQGQQVTLLDSQSQPLARWAQQKAGEQVLSAWDHLPIRFLGGVSVSTVEPGDGGWVVHTACGQRLVAQHIVAATGLATPSRLARSAGLAWDQGIAVDPTTLATSHPNIHALGDCITVHGQASRYIEPILRQAKTIAAKLVARRQGAAQDDCPVAYEAKPAVVRVKTTSCPLTLH